MGSQTLKTLRLILLVVVIKMRVMKSKATWAINCILVDLHMVQGDDVSRVGVVPAVPVGVGCPLQQHTLQHGLGLG